jgi:hypothetical protein
MSQVRPVPLSSSLSDAWNALRAVPRAARAIASEAAGGAEAVPKAIASGFRDVLDLGRYVKAHPPSPGQIGRTLGAVAEAVRSGETAVIPGDMPAYVGLDPAEIEAARRRGQGRTVAQPYITHDVAGQGHHEPIGITVTGSLDDLSRALASQGWSKAPALTGLEKVKMAAKVLLGTEKAVNGPVSRMYVDGREAVAAFNKNDDHNAGRDHLRIFRGGTDAETGQPVWRIAATRDVAATIAVPRPTFDGLKPDFAPPRSGHRTDPAIDRERDLIMHDLLASGAVAGWAAVDGRRTGVPETALPDGRVQIGQRVTDGRVYDVRL